MDDRGAGPDREKDFAALIGSQPRASEVVTDSARSLVEAYEAEHWTIEAPDPIAAIEHVMEARGLRQKDFAALIGSQPRASEVLNRQRPLTLPMIRALSINWNLPADVLVREYDLANAT